MTPIPPATNTLACDPETRQLSGFANWPAAAEPQFIGVDLALPDGQLPPAYQGTNTITLVGTDGTSFDGCCEIFANGVLMASTAFNIANTTSCTIVCDPPLVMDTEHTDPSRSLVLSFKAEIPAGVEVIFTPEFGV